MLWCALLAMPGCEVAPPDDAALGVLEHTGDWWTELERAEAYPPFECPGDHNKPIYGFDTHSAPSGSIWYRVTDQAWAATTEDADKAKAAQICEGAFFGPERATFLANQKATDRCKDKKLAFHCEEKDPLKRPCTTGRDDTCMDPDNDDIVSACREKATVLPYYTNVVAGCQIDCSLFVRGDALITCSVAPM